MAAWLALLELVEDDELELALDGWLLLLADGCSDEEEAAELLEVAGWLLEVAGMLPVVEADWLAEEAVELLAAAGWLLDEAADGWLLLVEPDDGAEAEAPPDRPSAARVCWSTWPDPERPCACWKLCSAACVFGPILPSIAPGSMPLSFNACWTCFTWLSPAEEDLVEAFGASMAVLGWAELAEAELVDALVEGWLAAKAADTERASAERASFLIMVNSFPLRRGTAAMVSAWPLLWRCWGASSRPRGITLQCACHSAVAA